MSPLPDWGRRAGVVGAGVGVVAAGAVLGFVGEKLAVGRLRKDSEADERFGSLRGAVVPVTADDGTDLHVEVDGPTPQEPAELTVVWCHGYANTSDTWHYQRRDLRRAGERFVFWDQRSHGRSGRGHRDKATIDQLGRDLAAVIEAVVPRGPVALVGHSMGGMTIMALSDQRPELFGPRVIAVAFLNTSPGGLAEHSFGVPLVPRRLLRRLTPGLVSAVGRQHELVERARRVGSDLAFVITKHYSFASDVPPAVVDFTGEMIASTPIDVIAEFFPSLHAHEKLSALRPLNNGVEVLVLAAADDLMTPARHSAEILTAVPGAEHVVVEDAGHMVMLEKPDAVNTALRALLDRAGRAARESGGRRPRARAT